MMRQLFNIFVPRSIMLDSLLIFHWNFKIPVILRGRVANTTCAGSFRATRPSGQAP